MPSTKTISAAMKNFKPQFGQKYMYITKCVECMKSCVLDFLPTRSTFHFVHYSKVSTVNKSIFTGFHWNTFHKNIGCALYKTQILLLHNIYTETYYLGRIIWCKPSISYLTKIAIIIYFPMYCREKFN